MWGHTLAWNTHLRPEQRKHILPQPKLKGNRIELVSGPHREKGEAPPPVPSAQPKQQSRAVSQGSLVPSPGERQLCQGGARGSCHSREALGSCEEAAVAGPGSRRDRLTGSAGKAAPAGPPFGHRRDQRGSQPDFPGSPACRDTGGEGGVLGQPRRRPEPQSPARPPCARCNLTQPKAEALQAAPGRAGRLRPHGVTQPRVRENTFAARALSHWNRLPREPESQNHTLLGLEGTSGDGVAPGRCQGGSPERPQGREHGQGGCLQREIPQSPWAAPTSHLCHSNVKVFMLR